jgi:hypothetical protein
MAPAVATYEPRDPSRTVLYKVEFIPIYGILRLR